MLLEFGARNFFSFKEGFDFSLELNGNCPESISKGCDVAHTIGIKGANASGKTNVLRALSFVRYLCTESFNAAPKAKIPFKNFYDNADSTNLFCRFALNGVKYSYEVELTNREILSEELCFDESGKKIFRRDKTEWTFTGNDFVELKKIKIRANVSVIHSAHMNEFEPLEPFSSFFENIITNVTDVGMADITPDISWICQKYRENTQIFGKVKNFLIKADTGIVDIKIQETMGPQGKAVFFPMFVHKVNDKDFQVPVWHESSGTAQLFCSLVLYFQALSFGGVLLLDEFDTNLHPDILPLLLDLFNSDEKNPHNAQIIFSTHDTAVMDLLGKYRTYLVNKRNNESFGYRLDEIPGDVLRNDRPVSKPYRDGKIGGVPRTE